MSTTWEAEGKTFIITGGASGLGAAYVEVFLKLGAKAIAILDVAEEVGVATTSRLNKSYPDKVTFVKCDVNDEDNISRAFDEVVKKFKRIDVIINNAGIMVDTPSIWRTACNVNWQGLVSFNLKGIKHMSKHEGGSGGTIVNISSTAALIKLPFIPIYNGSKMAVLHFSQCIAMDPFYENTGVRILTMCFGPTDTPLLQGLDKRSYDPELGRVFLKSVKEANVVFQKVDSAVASFVHMFKNGPPGSIWLSANNKPVKNITSDIDEVFQKWEQLIDNNYIQHYTNMATTWETEGKTFLITGGASGLGAAYVEVFLKLGAQAIAILDVAEELGEATASRLNKTYPDKVIFVKCDVSEEENISKAFDKVLEKFKRIDVIINNAGIMVDAPNTWRIACNVNWQGLVSFTLKGINHMSKTEGGSGGTIVNIASTAAFTKFPFLPIYNGSKIAVLHFSQCIAMDPFYENTGVRILTICFGPTDTALLQGLENRSYNSEMGRLLLQFVKEADVIYQTIDSAVEAFVHMFKNGPPGSIWLSKNNKPVQNITPDIDEAFQKWGQLLNNN